MALAIWIGSGVGAAAAQAGALPQGNTPSASASGTDIAVSWTQNTVNGSFLGTQSGGGYVVRRYAQSSSTATTPGTACSGTISGSTSTLTCTEHSVPGGTWQYTVTPVLGSWRGTESAKSGIAGVPGISIVFPSSGGRYDDTTWPAGCASAGFCGTASDTSGSGLANVKVSIRQGSGNYWNGTSFGGGAQILFTASGTTSWSYGFAASNFPAEGSYTVTAVATDNNSNTSSSSTTFVIDRTAPVVTLTSPANNALLGTAEPTFSGAAGTATGDTTTVTVKIYSGPNVLGTLIQTRTTTASGSSWTVGASPGLSDGQFTAQAQQSDTAGSAGSSSPNTFTVDSTAPTSTITFPTAPG